MFIVNGVSGSSLHCINFGAATDLRTEYGKIYFSGYEMMENENGDAAEYRKQAPGSAVIRVSAENGDIKIRENVAQSTLEETVAETTSVDEEE